MKPEEILEVLRSFLAAKGRPSDGGIEPETSLYAEGLGLDSVEAAELSAVLERRFGCDPYSQGIFPETVADLLRFYQRPSRH
jgi:acyl carrier protein